jgi:hypothetical protein
MLKFRTAFLLYVAPALFGQAATPPSAFHQNDWIGLPGAGAMTVHNLRPEGQTGPVLGRPFSATELRHSRQTLADGTNVDHSDTSAFYRDAQGRMRTESARRVLIYDPVGGFTYNLDLANRIYEKYPIRSGIGSTSIAVVGDSTWVKSANETGPHMPVESVPAGSRSYHGETAGQPVTEDLSVQNVNGIAARGSRIIITIPAGTFGNDRDIKVVNERWYSDVLQVLVKTVNSDPRFGVTTYDLANIVHASPDPGLFQIPAGFRFRASTTHQ